MRINYKKSGLGLNANYNPYNKNIILNLSTKPEVKKEQNLNSQAPIKRFQKSYIKNSNLASDNIKKKESQNSHNMNYFHAEEKNNLYQFLKNNNFQNNIKYHEIDMTTKKQNNINNLYKKNDGGKIDLNEFSDIKNSYYINNNFTNNFFIESLRKKENNNKCRNTFNNSKINS